mmetsp:Transcript_7652/g.28185  ORF Transcript_7652/g.28185 Transcript_7652/m.28185 type:complete len:331 (-) Transcript_7652:292-1284(-)
MLVSSLVTVASCCSRFQCSTTCAPGRSGTPSSSVIRRTSICAHLWMGNAGSQRMPPRPRRAASTSTSPTSALAPATTMSSCACAPSISIALTLPTSPDGISCTLAPRCRMPPSTLPRTATLPRARECVIARTSVTMKRSGTRSSRGTAGIRSMVSMSEAATVPPLVLYQERSRASCAGRATFSPLKALTGTYFILSPWKPMDLRKGASCVRTSLNRWAEKSTPSILFMATMSHSTPRLRTSSACSLVCPPTLPPTGSRKPLSKPPGSTSTHSTAASACVAPAIMLGTKSRWPGESRMTTLRPPGAVTAALPTSTVTPFSRSSGRWSMTQA